MQERKLMELAEAAGTIAIVGHVRPDGDCVGSCLAVCNYITEQYPEKTVDVYLETPPVKFSYLKQFERICSDPETGKQYDLCICLDSGDRERLGKNVVYLDTAKTSIVKLQIPSYMILHTTVNMTPAIRSVFLKRSNWSSEMNAL